MKLSDELVYLASKFLSVKARGARYQADFDKNGLVRAGRIPEDP